jgi:hypothetical protein
MARNHGHRGGDFDILDQPTVASESPQAPLEHRKNEIIFAITGPSADLEYHVDLAFFIAFGPVEGVAGQPVLDVLDAMASEVERIVLAIEAEMRRLRLII